MRHYPPNVTILLLLPPGCWDYGNEPQFLVSNSFLKTVSISLIKCKTNIKRKETYKTTKHTEICD